ncbi:MAG: DUF421 domain-containing protein [Bacilli bacterium]|nr:DUF421 domain-containing protein [Bacilli bacterium]
MKYVVLSFRSVLFYVIVTVVYRIMGKREIGELSMIDFIVSMFIADLVVISIENYQESIFVSLVPIFLLVMLQIITSKLSLKSKSMRDLLDGKPSVIINKGKVNFQEMRRLRYNLDDLLSQLREDSVRSINEVDYAILEPNGRLSIFPKEKNSPYPMAVILNGVIEKDVLVEIHKTEEWLLKQLNHKQVLLEDVFYAFYQNQELYLIENDKVR